MQIEKIKINNFRNIEKAEVDPGNKINFIVGENGQGKTNFIESIYTAAVLKSFRTRNNRELIKDKENSFNLKVYIKNGKSTNNINFKYHIKTKKIEVNDKKPENNYYFKYLNVIVFHPDEVNYINSYPLFRRNLIDRSIFYTNYNYINIYKKYFKCLKQRNFILKTNKSNSHIWEEQLCKYGSQIIKERLKYIDKINNYLFDDSFIKSNDEIYSLSYSKKYPDLDSIEDNLKEEFEKKRIREKIIGHTLVGPHKEDISFYINKKLASSFASQGQKRSLVISFKTAQILDYQGVHGYTPVLILDDMTSELDSNRKKILLENLLNNSGQVFITSTDLMQNKISDQNRVFKVNNGEICLYS